MEKRKIDYMNLALSFGTGFFLAVCLVGVVGMILTTASKIGG